MMLALDSEQAVIGCALPHNLEAEQCLLGALMFDNAVFERLPEHLRGSHFYEPFHQRLYDEIASCIGKGILAEPTILIEAFRADPACDQFGGLRYLADLMDRAPPGSNAPDYAKVIHDLALRRDLIRIGGEMIHDAPDPETTAADLLTAAEAKLFTLAETGATERTIVTFGEALDKAVTQAKAAYARDGKLTGQTTGLIDLDQKLGGLHPSDLLILAGRPSMGKTALALNITVNAARSGARVFFPSLEMSDEQLGLRALADFANVSGDRLRKGMVTREEIRAVEDARDYFRDLPIHIDDTGGLHIAKLCARARRLHRKHGLDLIMVDYLQLITTDAGKAGNRVQEVATITGALKALAKELNVPVLALSQLSRQVESREDKRPMLSDLRESGSIEQDADVVMFVYREAYYLGRSEPTEGSSKHLDWQEQMARAQGRAEVIVGKQRHGPIGTVHLSFDEDLTRFGNLAREDRYEGGQPRVVYSHGGQR
jgi:replicative DNA helicase